MPDIKFLFQPESIAIVGASSNKGKLGHTVISNLISGGYKGKVFPVNPAGGEILGLPVFKDVNAIPAGIDLVVIIIPAGAVLEVVRSCADRRTKFAAIITSGFSEIGNSEVERTMVSYANAHDMRILGPNIIGIYSSSVLMNATFGPGDIPAGNVAIVTQSGALGVGMIGKAKVENIGLSAIVSIGNKADLDEVEILNYLAADADTRVVMMYIEGITHGEKLVEILRAVTRIKPVVVVKSGRSKRGAMAAASHTGSLAGEDRVFDDIARQCGVIRAEGLQEAMEWCKFLATVPQPGGENTVIITNGGGIGVLTADACEKYGINLYDNLPDLKKTFASVVPEFGSTKNPVDMTGQATADNYITAIDAALQNDNINSVICLGCEAGSFEPDKFTVSAEDLVNAGKLQKPVVFSFVGGSVVEDAIQRLKFKGMPVFNDVLQATSCLAAIYDNYRQKVAAIAVPEQLKIDEQVITGVLEMVKKEGRRLLYSFEAQRIMGAVGIAGPESKIARSLEEAINFAGDIGYPVVMKVVSRDIVHKSDAGGVALDIDNKEEVADAYEAIMQNCRRFNADAQIEGIEVSQQVSPGVETIVGARRDLSFGPIVMFGLGGIYVEVMKDISFRSFPLSYSEATKMISEIKTYP
ncbi:MAG: acetate--CoA ligase family protein, partial [Chloroflexi bacterium]|nr:acetate--CoA ligase family protein [Chloroflexota bacterium]